MARQIYCIGVWKDQLTCNASISVAKSIISNACASDFPFIVGIAPAPFCYLSTKEILDQQGFISAAQNIMWHEVSGTYIGETTSEMLKEQNCKFVIVGHSERRITFSETDEIVSKKFQTCIDEGLFPITCLGDTAEDRANGTSQDKISSQLDAILSVERMPRPDQFALAYEPVWAISTWRNAEPLPNGDVVEAILSDIRNKVAKRTNAEFAESLSILYGGSVNSENGADYLSHINVDGALIGGASKTAESFLATLEACKQGFELR